MDILLLQLTQATNMFFDRLDRMNFAAANRCVCVCVCVYVCACVCVCWPLV